MQTLGEGLIESKILHWGFRYLDCAQWLKRLSYRRQLLLSLRNAGSMTWHIQLNNFNGCLYINLILSFVFWKARDEVRAHIIIHFWCSVHGSVCGACAVLTVHQVHPWVQLHCPVHLPSALNLWTAHLQWIGECTYSVCCKSTAHLWDYWQCALSVHCQRYGARAVYVIITRAGALFKEQYTL